MSCTLVWERYNAGTEMFRHHMTPFHIASEKNNSTWRLAVLHLQRTVPLEAWRRFIKYSGCNSRKEARLWYDRQSILRGLSDHEETSDELQSSLRELSDKDINLPRVVISWEGYHFLGEESSFESYHRLSRHRLSQEGTIPITVCHDVWIIGKILKFL